MIPRILIVAGSDSGGGAGIQADLKTVTMLGGFAMTAVTAITVQNTLGVSDVHPIPIPVIAGQIEAVLSDLGADAVKIGMLGDEATVVAVADALEQAFGANEKRLPIILDPVMIAKGGSKLLADSAISAMRARLLPICALVTPNAPELGTLIGREVNSEADMLEGARELLAMGAPAVLAKGGHIDGDIVTDWLVTPEKEQCWQSPRLYTRHTHGTGCTLASAVSAGIAAGLPLDQAVDRGRAYVQAALAAAPGLGQGHGPLGHNFRIL